MVWGFRVVKLRLRGLGCYRLVAGFLQSVALRPLLGVLGGIRVGGKFLTLLAGVATHSRRTCSEATIRALSPTSNVRTQHMWVVL